MENEYILTSDGELIHWGIKGQKWGIRRYQNKDGSLTPAGQKRYNAEMSKLKEREKIVKNQEKTKAKIEKLSSKQAELDAREAALKADKKKKNAKPETGKPVTKKIGEMSDDELRERITRMQLTKSYLDAQKNLNEALPKQVSKGQKFVSSLMDDVIVPAAKNAGKAWAENKMKDMLGLNKKDVDPLKKLENEAKKVENEYKKLEYKEKIKKLKNADPDDDMTWDERLKKQQYTQAQKKTAEAQDEYEEYLERKRKG